MSDVLRRSNETDVELRADGDAKEITGTAAVFYDGTRDTEFVLDPGGQGRRKVVERILPGAFDKVMRERNISDTRALFNHNSDHLLGRRSSGTLKLEVTGRGLGYAIPFDAADPDHQRVAAKMQRGDLRGSSFAFSLGEKDMERKIEGDVGVVEIRSVDKLYDVGPVTFPAYGGTDAGMRGHNPEAELKQFRKWEAEQEEAAAAAAKEAIAAENATWEARAKLAGM
jgi:HK97 family phage prohead protease